MTENNREMKNLRDEFAKSTTSEKEAEIHMKLREIVGSNNRELNIVRDVVEELGGEIKAINAAKEQHRDVESRMKLTMHATLVK